MTYDFDADVLSTVDDTFKYKKFTAGQNFKQQAGLRQTFDNTINIGPAYNTPLVLGFYGCYSCDPKSISGMIVDK